MNKEKVINILKSFEYFIDDDWGGYYANIDCSQRATTPLGILQILDYIDDLNNENTNLKQALNEIREYFKNLRNFHIEAEFKGKQKVKLYASEKNFVNDILQIINKILGDDNNGNK